MFTFLHFFGKKFFIGWIFFVSAVATASDIISFRSGSDILAGSWQVREAEMVAMIMIS